MTYDRLFKYFVVSDFWGGNNHCNEKLEHRCVINWFEFPRNTCVRFVKLFLFLHSCGLMSHEVRQTTRHWRCGHSDSFSVCKGAVDMNHIFLIPCIHTFIAVFYFRINFLCTSLWTWDRPLLAYVHYIIGFSNRLINYISPSKSTKICRFFKYKHYI